MKEFILLQDKNSPVLENEYWLQLFQNQTQDLVLLNREYQAAFWLPVIFVIILITMFTFHKAKVRRQQITEQKMQTEKILQTQCLLQSNIDRYLFMIKKNKGRYPSEQVSSQLPNFHENLIACIDMKYHNISERLEKKFPELTQNDIFLCCFLLVGMDSGEIALLHNVNIESIYKRRCRLRTKLNLNHSENLIEFLQNF